MPPALWYLALRALESHFSVLGRGMILFLEKTTNNFSHDHDGLGVVLLILENDQDK